MPVRVVAKKTKKVDKTKSFNISSVKSGLDTFGELVANTCPRLFGPTTG